MIQCIFIYKLSNKLFQFIADIYYIAAEQSQLALTTGFHGEPLNE